MNDFARDEIARLSVSALKDIKAHLDTLLKLDNDDNNMLFSYEQWDVIEKNTKSLKQLIELVEKCQKDQEGA